ncbi:hypothetical protein [Sediminibacillus terrae]|uniref:hypothetical protein n=1 Tax=Sediminibacillus terrae TaxID=1562106 RepID=UPI0012949C8E|nr:hypothetical protein [Sediminibacillus terrae]
MLFKGRKVSPKLVREALLNQELINEINKFVPVQENSLEETSAVEIFITTKEEQEQPVSVDEADLKTTAVFLKQGNNLGVELTHYHNLETGREDSEALVSVVNIEDNNIIKRKLIFENGAFAREHFVDAKTAQIEFVAETFLLEQEQDAGSFTTLSSDPDEFWGVPCFDIYPTAGTECCQFRYNGLPWNELVTYNYCGAGCTKSWLDPVNPLDACCKVHDSCYSSRGYGSCYCDYQLISCAEGTDEAGGSRLIFAFEQKVKYGFCN